MAAALIVAAEAVVEMAGERVIAGRRVGWKEGDCWMALDLKVDLQERDVGKLALIAKVEAGNEILVRNIRDGEAIKTTLRYAPNCDEVK